MTQSLTNKVVIITGASSGIGEAFARRLAAEGCKLTLAARSVDKLEALAGQLDAETLVAPADMTEPADIAAMVEDTQARFGRIDVLCANAGNLRAWRVCRWRYRGFDAHAAHQPGRGAARRPRGHPRHESAGEAATSW